MENGKLKGFTLLEVMVVMGVLSIIGVIILTIFTRTLKGNNKAQILVAMKQNGQSVLDNMSQTIRNADNFVCSNNNINLSGTTSPNNSTAVVVKNGVYTRYRIAMPSDNTGPTTCKMNGCIISDNPTPQAADTSPQLFINRVCSAADLMSSAQIQTDTSPQTGVSIKGGGFTMPANKKSGFKDSITINFVLGPGLSAPPAVSGSIDALNFETTIQLR